MGDLAKARMELEEMYLGIPDDSVNLTFQDLADMKQKANASDKKKSTSVQEPLQEAKNPKQGSPLSKLPSLDFKRGLQATNDHIQEHGYEDMDMGHHHQSHRSHATSPRGNRHGLERSLAYDDVSVISMASTYPERGQRRRPGIPHSNICTICTTYIYIFRHRCLVCGRVYCRQCVFMGMGEMTEGRKCTLCLGRRFSQRYIKRAGKMGCFSRYPSNVKQAELKWAEKGPRRSGERAYGQASAMMSRSRSPANPRTHATSTTPSFIASSPSYSPYAPTHHHLPL
ncbi:hypothetical protein PTKIN_Ptkin03bG0000800 [Pterospermum kingtungense]